MAADQELLDRIAVDPSVMVGKPVVRGTRIPVESVLGFLAEKPDLGELLAAYPHLTVDDVKACLAYARGAVRRQGRRGRGASENATHAASA
ncbi:MAG: DUF433 domain-containing protein [Chloroflexota bacterium]